MFLLKRIRRLNRRLRLDYPGGGCGGQGWRRGASDPAETVACAPVQSPSLGLGTCTAAQEEHSARVPHPRKRRRVAACVVGVGQGNLQHDEWLENQGGGGGGSGGRQSYVLHRMVIITNLYFVLYIYYQSFGRNYFCSTVAGRRLGG